jgi:hypothetical protein
MSSPTQTDQGVSEHKPRFRYDCENCKYNWCCGHLCACALENLPSVDFIEQQVAIKQEQWRNEQAEINPETLEAELDALE